MLSTNKQTDKTYATKAIRQFCKVTHTCDFHGLQLVTYYYTILYAVTEDVMYIYCYDTGFTYVLT